MQLVKMKSPANWVDRIGGIVTFGTPHLGAAIAEPGFKSGREAAVYLMMLNSTKRAASIGDVLTLIGERAVEGIEDGDRQMVCRSGGVGQGATAGKRASPLAAQEACPEVSTAG